MAASTIALAIVTDIYDGKLARHYNSASPLGGFGSRHRCARLPCSSAWALAQNGLIHAWLWPFIGFRFFAQYALDSKILRAAFYARANWVNTMALATCWPAPLLAARPWQLYFKSRFSSRRYLPSACSGLITQSLSPPGCCWPAQFFPWENKGFTCCARTLGTFESIRLPLCQTVRHSPLAKRPRRLLH